MDDYDEYDDNLFTVPEFRFVEFRAIEGRTVYGNVVVYGDITQTRMGRETFEPGAFGDVSQLDTILHMQHERARPIARTNGGGLVLTDSPERLEIAAEMPNTRDGNDALELATAEYSGDLVRSSTPRVSGMRAVLESSRRQPCPALGWWTLRNIRSPKYLKSGQPKTVSPGCSSMEKTP